MFQSLVSFEHWTFIAQILNLFIQIALFKKFLFKPVKKIIEKRQQEVDAVLSEAEAAKANALSVQTDYEEKMLAVQKEAESIRSEAINAAKEKSAQLIADAQAEAAAIREKANKDIELELARVMSQAREDISEMAVDIAGKLIKKDLDDNAHIELAKQFIDEIGGSDD